jgi:hypothetical protein
LYRLGETIGAEPDAALIPGMALRASLEITDADLGAVILREDDCWQVAAVSKETGRELDDLETYAEAARGDATRPGVITEVPAAFEPYSSLLWARLAELALARGNPTHALDITDRLIASAPGMPPGRVITYLWWLKGKALAALGHSEEAQPLLHAAIENARRRRSGFCCGACTLAWGDCTAPRIARFYPNLLSPLRL